MKNHKIFGLAIVCILSVISLQSPAQRLARKFYVSVSGNDENPGSKTRPLQTLSKVNTLRLAAGDSVFFRAGEVFRGTLVIDSGTSGTAKNPVVITSYGSGRAVINGGDSAGIRVYKSLHLKIWRIGIVGSGRKTGNAKDGLSIINCRGINLDDIDISGFQKSGLMIFASQTVTANGIFTHDNGAAGITVEGPYQKRESHDIRIVNCRAENNPGDPTKLDNHSGNGIIVGNCKNVVIDRCTATNNGWDMPRIGNGPVGIWAYEADSVTIQHCLSYHNKTAKGAADGGGFDFDGGVTHSVIQYCLSYGNEGSGLCIFQYWGASPWHDNVYRYNISEDDGTVSDSQAGVYVWNSSGDENQFYNCQVYGNIIYNSKVAAITFAQTSKSRGFRFYHNIFVAKDTLIHGRDESGNVVFEGNDWWSLRDKFNMYGITDFHTWATKRGEVDSKITGLNIEPKFSKPGKTTVTSAEQLKSFTNYKLPNDKSQLVRKLKLGKSGWFH